MATVELIAELHEIKESLCDAVKHVPEFSELQQNTRYTNHIYRGQQMQLTAPAGKTWTDVGNVTQEFERLVKLCGKGNVFDIDVKKFELKEKIPTAQTKLLAAAQATSLTNATATRDVLQKYITDTKCRSDIVNNNIKLYKDLCAAYVNLIRKHHTYHYNNRNCEYPHNDDENNMCDEYIRLCILINGGDRDKIHSWYPNGIQDHNLDYTIKNYITRTDQETADANCQLALAQQLLNQLVTEQKFREVQATALHARLTALINMIPVFNSNFVKVKNSVRVKHVKKTLQPQSTHAELNTSTHAELNTPQNKNNAGVKTHQINVENCELRNLQQSDSSLLINNLAEFAHVRFYFRKSEAFGAVYLYHKGQAQYLVADDHKLYVFVRGDNVGGKLVQGTHYDKLQCWAA